MTTGSYTLPERILAQLSERIAGELGLHFPPERWADLDRAVRAVCAHSNAGDPLSFIQRFLDSRAGREGIDALSIHLTVGETYFFRDKRIFDILETHILPALTGEEVRIWSAGCASGEEPYSIAMLFRRLFPDRPITIIATDLNPRSLHKASEAIYGEWSFRETPQWIRSKYFSQVGHGRWKLDPSIRQMVEFSRLNLVKGPVPGIIQPVDIIFCRNVLMYLHPLAAKRIVASLRSCLKDGGWLIVGAAETSVRLFEKFTAVNFDGATLYRKGGDKRPDPLHSDLLPSTAPIDLPVIEELPTPQPLPDRSLRRSPAMLRLARFHANHGNLTEAIRWCEQAIQLAKTDPRAHYLRATILQEMGSLDEASRSLRRALYLDPNFAIAHFALGNLTSIQGKTTQSVKHLKATLDLLAAYKPETVLPESDGLTAGSLRELILHRVHG